MAVEPVKQQIVLTNFNLTSNYSKQFNIIASSVETFWLNAAEQKITDYSMLTILYYKSEKGTDIKILLYVAIFVKLMTYWGSQ